MSLQNSSISGILPNSLQVFPFLWYHMLTPPSILSDKLPLERTLLRVNDFNRPPNAGGSDSHSSCERVTFLMCGYVPLLIRRY